MLKVYRTQDDLGINLKREIGVVNCIYTIEALLHTLYQSPLNDIGPDCIMYIVYVYQACTAGGCRLSESSLATTEESAPDGIPDPEIVSSSPNLLNVSWGFPDFPNGEDGCWGDS